MFLLVYMSMGLGMFIKDLVVKHKFVAYTFIDNPFNVTIAVILTLAFDLLLWPVGLYFTEKESKQKARIKSLEFM